MPDFETHPVIRTFEATPTLFVPRIEPVWPNQNQHDFAFCQTLFKHLGEFGSGTHVDIDKHTLAAKLVFQILADAERVSASVLTAIAYENLLGHLQYGARRQVTQTGVHTNYPRNQRRAMAVYGLIQTRARDLELCQI